MFGEEMERVNMSIQKKKMKRIPCFINNMFHRVLIEMISSCG